MRTLLSDPPPAELREALDELLERRRQWGADRHDEVWEGVLHMNPISHWRHAELQAQLLELLRPLARAVGLRAVGPINLGERNDYRVPDGAITEPGPGALYNPTARLVIEILSPGDESWRKLGFYAAHDVSELLIVDPDQRRVHWLALDGAEYRPVERSGVIDLGCAELEAQLEWPAPDPSSDRR
ncbi:MAG: Uma2 family endonuclease [Solirubrobacteraceae bacterium]